MADDVITDLTDDDIETTWKESTVATMEGDDDATDPGDATDGDDDGTDADDDTTDSDADATDS